MASEQQATDYRADTRITQLAEWLADPVSPTGFPGHNLRFRNDRWAAATALAGLSDEEWISHFGRFEPLLGNPPEPLALRYHGHQFRSYNPDLSDGRLTLKGGVREHLNNTQVIDLTLVTGMYMMVSRFLETTGIEIDSTPIDWKRVTTTET